MELDIVNGKIPIVDLAPGSAVGTAGGVTQAEFNGYKTDKNGNWLCSNRRWVEGGTPLDLFCSQHWKIYLVLQSPLGLMGSVTDSVVCQSKIDDRMLMGTRTNLTLKQSRIIASFSATYRAILAGPKVGHSQDYDFGALKTFKDWNFGYC